MAQTIPRPILILICIFFAVLCGIYIYSINHNNSVEEILADKLNNEPSIFEQYVFETTPVSTYVAVSFKEQDGTIGYSIFERRKNNYTLIRLNRYYEMGEAGSQIYYDLFSHDRETYSIFLVNNPLVDKFIWKYGNSNGIVDIVDLPFIYVFNGPEPSEAELH